MALPLAIPIASAGITGARIAGPYIANLVRQYGPAVARGIFNVLGRDDVMTGEDLENIPVEEREAKKEKKKKQIKTVQGGRAAGMTADEQRAAAERGDFGQLEMSKKDDDEIIEVKDEDLIREERKDVSTGGEDPDEDPNKKTIIFDDAKTIARKLVQEGVGQLVDKGLEKLEEKITQTPGKKGKLIETGDETTEGTFRYQGKTYNKSDGVRIEYGQPKDPNRPTPIRQWIPKDVYGKPNIPPTENVKTRHVNDTVAEINKIFPNQNLHEITGPEMLDILRQNGYDTTLSTIFTAKNKIMGRGPTEEENRAKRIFDPDGFETADIGKALSRLDKKTYDQTKKFIKDISPNKLEKDILNRHLQRMVHYAKGEGASDAEILEVLNNVDKEKLIPFLKNVGELRDLNKQVRDLGINPMVQGKPYAINLSHKLPARKDWRKSFDPDNLFVSDSYGNLILQRSLEKQIKDIKDGLKNYKTLTEKKEFLKQSMPGFEGDKARTIKEVRQAFKDNRLISIFGDKVFGSPNPNDPYFIEQMRDLLTKRLETGKFKKDGGMVSMEEMIQPINAQR